MFLPEMREMQTQGVFRERERIQLSPYNDNLDDRVAAAVVWGVAKRYNCTLTAIEAGSREEYDIRRKVRGTFNSSFEHEMEGKTFENIESELEEHGITKEDIENLAKRVRETVQERGLDIDEESVSAYEGEDVEEYEPEEKKPYVPGQNRVAKVDVLFKIEGNENKIFYCRAHTVGEEIEDRSYVFEDYNDMPTSERNLTFEFQTLTFNRPSYCKFFEIVASHVSDVTFREINSSKLIKRLERELKERESQE